MRKIIILAIPGLGIFISGCKKYDYDPDEYYIKDAVGVQSNAIWVPMRMTQCI